MTSEQINLVGASFSKLAPVAEEAAVLFYVRLFKLNPSLRPLFTSDIREQGGKLMEMIGFAVKGLSRPEQLLPALRSLGARHAHYGVEESHYETVGAALLWTLEKALDEDFTPDAREAWSAVYNLLAETMKNGARQKAENAAVV